LKGGVALSQGNQSFLRFSLEESVWFQRGQEVEELVSISLDPNITIQENDQYVTIRGSLDLTGEYKCPTESVEDENETVSLQKWVNATREREDGSWEFSHQFPVDISIPSYRVRDLSEVDVLIDTFDYVLPERSCLKLTADLNISGLYGEETVEEVQEEEEEREEVVLELAHRFRAEEADETVEQETVEQNDPDFEPFEVEARKEDTYFTEPTLAESSSYQHQPVTPEIHFAAFRSEGTTAPSEMEEEVQEISGETNVEQEVESPEESPEVNSPPAAPTANVIDMVKKKLSGNKKSMSISEFLARKDGDDHAKLKVCIVQNGESVDSLAERYNVPVQQLLKVNHLELNQDVYEGQVLYVPSVPVRK
jgi:stage VI sporulation protein D